MTPNGGTYTGRCSAEVRLPMLSTLTPFTYTPLFWLGSDWGQTCLHGNDQCHAEFCLPEGARTDVVMISNVVNIVAFGGYSC